MCDPPSCDYAFSSVQVLKLEDLQSSSDSEWRQSSEPLTASRSTEYCLPPSAPNPVPSTGAKSEEGQKLKNKKTDMTKDDHKLRLIDIESDDSPGAVPIIKTLSSSMQSGSEETKKKREKESSKSSGTRQHRSGLGGQIEAGGGSQGRSNITEGRRQSWSRDGQVTSLLKTSSLEMASGSRVDPSLEDVFPELVSNLRKFDSFVLPAWKSSDDNRVDGWAAEPSKRTAPTFPILHLPQMAASSLPGTAMPRDQDSAPTHQWSHQPPPLFHFSPLHQPPSSSLHRPSPHMTPYQSQRLPNQHSSLPPPPPPPPSLSFFQPSSEGRDVKFPLLLPQPLHSGPSIPSNQGAPTPPYLSQVISPHVPPSLPSKAPPTYATSHSHTQAPPIFVPSQTAPPPPQLFQVPGLFPTGVVASLLVSPEQLLEQQEKMLNAVNVPRQLKEGHHPLAKKASMSEQEDSSIVERDEKSTLSLKNESLDGLSETSTLTNVSEECIDVSKSTATSGASGPHPHLKEKLGSKNSSKRVRKKKKTQVSVDSTTSKNLSLGNKNVESGKKQWNSLLVKDGKADDTIHLDQISPDDDDDDDDDVSLLDVKEKYPAKIKEQSEGEKKMKQMLEDAEKLSKMLKTSGEGADVEEVRVPPATWAEPSRGVIADLPDRLEPLESLELRRLNFYKMDPELEPSAARKEGSKIRSKRNVNPRGVKRDKESAGNEYRAEGSSSSCKDDILSEASSTITAVSSRTLTPDSLDASHHSGTTSPGQHSPEVVHSESSDMSLTSPQHLQLQLTHSISPPAVEQLPSLLLSLPSPHSSHFSVPFPQASQGLLGLASSRYGSSKFPHLPSKEDARVEVEPKQDPLQIEGAVPGISLRPPPLQLQPVTSPRSEVTETNEELRIRSPSTPDAVSRSSTTQVEREEPTRRQTGGELLCGMLESPPLVDTVDRDSSEPDVLDEDGSLQDLVGIPSFNSPTHSSTYSKNRLERETLR